MTEIAFREMLEGMFCGGVFSKSVTRFRSIRLKKTYRAFSKYEALRMLVNPYFPVTLEIMFLAEQCDKFQFSGRD